MLTIVVLITVSSADAEPQGTIIKGGILTYPAGPYLREKPLLLSLENHTGDNIPTQAGSFKILHPANEFMFFNNNSHNTTPGNLSSWNFWIY